jgi:hypothetical protein
MFSFQHKVHPFDFLQEVRYTIRVKPAHKRFKKVKPAGQFLKTNFITKL